MTRRKLLFLLWLGSLPIIGQTQITSENNHAIAAKVLGIDYGTPNDVDGLDVTFGLELNYQYLLSKHFGLALPLKIGVADVEGDTRNRNITSVDALLHIYPAGADGKLVPYLLGGAGIVIENLEESNTQIPLGLGLNFMIGTNSYLNVQGEYRVSSTDLRDNLQIGGGYVYRFGKSDRDGDTVADGIDECPDVFGLVELNGCPDRDGDGVADQNDECPDSVGPPETAGCPDADGDGIVDKMDACPEEAGTVAGCPDMDGDGVADNDDACPTVVGPQEMAGCPDTDGDGLHDGQDECPTEAGSLAARGCPANDADNDGIVDQDDACPEEAGPAATNGCPDTDGDGVADADDRCPEVAGPYTGCPDTDGDGVMDAEDRCPEESGLITNKGCPELREEIRDVLNLAMRAVQFETGSANLKPASYNVLDQIAGIMEQYPAYQLRIAGHTDNVGDAEANQTLSEDRAKACFDYLVSKGIAESQMTHAGYGEDQAVADNSSADGRSLNRRVEFDLIIQ